MQLQLGREFPALIDDDSAVGTTHPPSRQAATAGHVASPVQAGHEVTKLQLLTVPARKAPDSSVALEVLALRAGARPEDELLRVCQGELLEEYLRLAEGFGFECPYTDAIRLRHLLAAQGTTLYDRPRVKEWLDRKCGGEFVAASPNADRPTPSWGWRPLRRQDARSNGKVRPRLIPSRSDEILETSAVYDKVLPLAVLRTAARIQQQFPTAKFFVSDRLRCNERDMLHDHHSTAEPSVDAPFLAVELIAQRELFIVERWDATSA